MLWKKNNYSFVVINVCDTPSAMGYFAVTSKSSIPGSTLRRSMDPSGTTWKKKLLQCKL